MAAEMRSLASRCCLCGRREPPLRTLASWRDAVECGSTRSGGPHDAGGRAEMFFVSFVCAF